MPAFRYKAKNAEGQSVEGVIEASDERTAAVDLRQKGYYILSIDKLHGDPRTSIAPSNVFDVFCRWFYNPIFGGATVAQLAFFYRQLASMIKAGIPIVQAMSSLRTRAGNRRLRKIANETMEYLRQGGRLSESFSRYPWMFSEMQIHLLRAGEEAGTLDRLVGRIADMLDREVHLRQRLRLATLYPKILVLAVIFIPAFPVLVFQGPQAYFDKTIANIIPVALYLAVIWVLY
ncbi:MAG: type II secretion system F family protein, partial [Armatimonadota bacterium]